MSAFVSGKPHSIKIETLPSFCCGNLAMLLNSGYPFVKNTEELYWSVARVMMLRLHWRKALDW